MMAGEIDKEALKRSIEAAHPEWRKSRPMPKPLRHVVDEMIKPATPVQEVGCVDPWIIMRVQPNSYKTAETSLTRAGFEFYSPTYKVLRRRPLRAVPPKKRALASLYLEESRRRRFEGYIFIRRIFGHHDLNRMFDLNGCGSVVVVTGSLAMVQDYEVELMRWAEEGGLLDQVTVEAWRGYKVNRLPEDGSDRYTGVSKIVGRIDESSRTVLFVQRMGRIERLIAQADRQGSR